MVVAAAPRDHFRLQPTAAAQRVTLLELVQAVADVTDDDREVVAAVISLLRSGRVILGGNFREASPDFFLL